jgi:hypothetical protein
MTVTPPHGLTEADYEAIEAAVTETVRGRWFLAEYARRIRLAETNDILNAIGRIETTVLASLSPKESQLPPPAPADPSIRLLMQRIREISGHLGAVASQMRDEGIDERFAAAVDLQARAVSGLVRSGSPVREVVPVQPVASEPSPPQAPTPPRLPKAELPAALVTAPSPLPSTDQADPRRVALSGLDRMSLSEKLAFFA